MGAGFNRGLDLGLGRRIKERQGARRPERPTQAKGHLSQVVDVKKTKPTGVQEVGGKPGCGLTQGAKKKNLEKRCTIFTGQNKRSGRARSRPNYSRGLRENDGCSKKVCIELGHGIASGTDGRDINRNWEDSVERSGHRS